jgi:hypothetical protein
MPRSSQLTTRAETSDSRAYSSGTVTPSQAPEKLYYRPLRKGHSRSLVAFEIRCTGAESQDCDGVTPSGGEDIRECIVEGAHAKAGDPNNTRRAIPGQQQTTGSDQLAQPSESVKSQPVCGTPKFFLTPPLPRGSSSNPGPRAREGISCHSSGLHSAELSPNLGDGLRDQAAAVWDCEDAGLAATSIPSVNLTP